MERVFITYYVYNNVYAYLSVNVSVYTNFLMQKRVYIRQHIPGLAARLCTPPAVHGVAIIIEMINNEAKYNLDLQ